jgi:hypothetical protein
VPVGEHNHRRKGESCADRAAQEDENARVAPGTGESIHDSSVRGARSCAVVWCLIDSCAAEMLGGMGAMALNQLLAVTDGICLHAGAGHA